MATSENPLVRPYWAGAVDARPLALFRIGLGLALLEDLWLRVRDASTFLTDDGVYPRSLLPSPAAWSLFNWAGDTASVTAILAAGALATLLFTFGFATRVSTAATWVFWVSLHRRVPIIHTGGDSIVDILLFLAIFTNLSGRWSLDAKRSGATAEVHAFVPRLMQIVPAMLYFYTAREKLRIGGRDWFFGPVIYEHMHLHGWLRPLGVTLGRYPMLCALFTGVTIFTELLLPALRMLPVWIRPARALAVVLHVGLQLGILLTMKVGVFTNLMLAVTCLWLQPGWLNRVGGLFARKPLGTPGEPSASRSPAKASLDVVLCVVLGIAMAQPAIPRHIPAFATRLVHDDLALEMSSGLFLAGFPSVRWEATGTLVDGTTIDPIRTAAPDADFDNDLLNSLWMQLPYRLERLSPLGRFVCERANRENGRARLAHWSLTRYSLVPYPAGVPKPAEERMLILSENCALR